MRMLEIINIKLSYYFRLFNNWYKFLTFRHGETLCIFYNNKKKEISFFKLILTVFPVFNVSSVKS